MSLYHLYLKPLGRANGGSIIAAIAYRESSVVFDHRQGIVHDYSRKQGVEYTELLLPGSTPSPMLSPADRRAASAEFWTRMDRHYKRGDATLGREFEAALPAEIPTAAKIKLALRFARELSDQYGVAAHISVHQPRKITPRMLAKNPGLYSAIDPHTGEQTNLNWHAHIVLSACGVGPNGELGKKVAALDPVACKLAKPPLPNPAELWRPRWEVLVNSALEECGIEDRVDHRSHAARGIDQAPQIHLGPTAAAMARAGKRAERGTRASELVRVNRARAEVSATVQEIEQQLRNLAASEPPVATLRSTRPASGRSMEDLRRIRAATSKAKRWGGTHDESLTQYLRWVDNKDPTYIRAFVGDAWVTFRKDKSCVETSRVTNHALRMMLDTIQREGWTDVELTGSDQFKSVMGRLLAANGVKVVGEPAQDARQTPPAIATIPEQPTTLLPQKPSEKKAAIAAAWRELKAAQASARLLGTDADSVARAAATARTIRAVDALKKIQPPSAAPATGATGSPSSSSFQSINEQEENHAPSQT